jgi:acyl carrier protein
VTALESPQLTAIQDWIASKHAEGVTVDLDTDLIESRLIDSLDFAEFLFLLEEISGRTIDLAMVDVQAFRTLRSIQSRFLAEG